MPPWKICHFSNNFEKIYSTSVSGVCMNSIFNIRHNCWRIMGQFRNFGNLIFGGFLTFWPNCELRRAVLVCIERDLLYGTYVLHTSPALVSQYSSTTLLPAMRCTAYMIKFGFARYCSKIKQYSKVRSCYRVFIQ